MSLRKVDLPINTEEEEGGKRSASCFDCTKDFGGEPDAELWLVRKMVFGLLGNFCYNTISGRWKKLGAILMIHSWIVLTLSNIYTPEWSHTLGLESNILPAWMFFVCLGFVCFVFFTVLDTIVIYNTC